MDTLEAESTVTKRGQTTLPSAIRKVLKLTKAEDRLRYRVLRDGSVVISKVEGTGDPMIADFLNFIEADARNNFAALRPVTPDWLTGIQALVKGVSVDLDAPLNLDDE